MKDYYEDTYEPQSNSESDQVYDDIVFRQIKRDRKVRKKKHYLRRFLILNC